MLPVLRRVDRVGLGSLGGESERDLAQIGICCSGSLPLPRRRRRVGAVLVAPEGGSGGLRAPRSSDRWRAASPGQLMGRRCRFALCGIQVPSPRRRHGSVLLRRRLWGCEVVCRRGERSCSASGAGTVEAGWSILRGQAVPAATGAGSGAGEGLAVRVQCARFRRLRRMALAVVDKVRGLLFSKVRVVLLSSSSPTASAFWKLQWLRWFGDVRRCRCASGVCVRCNQCVSVLCMLLL